MGCSNIAQFRSGDLSVRLDVEKGLEYANSTYDLGKRGGGTKRMPRDVVVFICSLRFPLPKLYQIMYALVHGVKLVSIYNQPWAIHS